MRIIAGFAVGWFMMLGCYFTAHNIKNDSAIARDTKRIADALQGVSITCKVDESNKGVCVVQHQIQGASVRAE